MLLGFSAFVKTDIKVFIQLNLSVLTCRTDISFKNIFKDIFKQLLNCKFK